MAGKLHVFESMCVRTLVFQIFGQTPEGSEEDAPGSESCCCCP